MKRIILIMAIAIFTAACAQHSCPTYGSHYSYSAPKKKAMKYKSSASSKKTVKRAEQD